MTDRPTRARGLTMLLLATVTMASSCGYVLPWNRPWHAQQAAAQRATPSALRATPDTEIGAVEPTVTRPLRPLRIRARATPRYAAEVADWARQLGDLVADANAVLGPTLSVRLEVESTSVWPPHRGDDELLPLLDELSASDPGEDVDWVVGLVGSVPRFEQSFHQLGLGRAGKHFVARAMNDAREYEGIQENLSALDEPERRKLYRERKRHKTNAVFLHELGHTLGVIHELDRTTLMAPTYDPKEIGFSVPAAAWLRMALEHRLEPAAATESAFTQSLVAHVEKTAPSWVASERDDLLARLRARLAALAAPPPSTPSRSAARAPGPSAPAAPEPFDLTSIKPADHAAFTAASDALRAGQPQEAWSRGKPLFTAYPDSYAVQDLRCQIALKLGLAWEEASAQCERLMQLTPTSTGAPPH